MPFSLRPQRTTLRSKILIGFGIVLAMLVTIATISVRSTRGFIHTADFVATTHEVLETQERIIRNVMQMESSRRGFLVTGDESLLRGFEGAQADIIQDFNALKVLTAGSSTQTAALERLRKLLHESFALQGSEIEARRQHGAAAATDIFRTRKTEDIAVAIRSLLLEAQVEQRMLLADRATLTDEIGSATTVAVIIGSALTIFALIIACLMILRDLAARHRAEEALAQEHNLLSSIINAIPDHVYVKDVKGRYILDNTAHRSYLGLQGAHAVEGKTVFDYFMSSMAAKFDADDRRVIETGEPMLNCEEPSLKPADNREIWLETTKVPLRDTDGKIVGLVGISSDISERKADEEKLRRFAAQLERSNAELQNFASVASHDLQEPLRKIQAFGDRLKAKCGAQLGEQGLDYLARMQNAAQRMQVLIQDLLKLSRVTSRAQPFERCDLQEIVTQVLSDIEVAIEQSGARIEVENLPTIDADPLQMRQLFQNLIANAIKFQKPGEPPEVSVSGRVFELQEHLIPGGWPGDQVCQIRIQDNGIGFDDKFAEQIFVVFQRLHSREQYEGTGIGLAVCRKITDRHGGTIVAKSAEGQGATFIITLPVKQPAQPAHE
jgi:two-component system, LuxR family, sensor kinase FixL